MHAWRNTVVHRQVNGKQKKVTTKNRQLTTKKMEHEQNVILLNNLFNGEYIKEKVGGEIINMYQSDNDSYYVYINPYGNIEKKWDNRIKYVLFIRTVKNGFVKVIGKAEIENQVCLNAKFDKKNNEIDPGQKKYIEDNEIKYGGAPISSLGSWSKYFVTFKAKGIYKPKADIYLSTDNNKSILYENVYYLQNVNKIANQSQKLYIDKNEQKENYQKIEEIIRNVDLWEENPVGKVIINETLQNNKSFLSIIRKEDDELVNSNLLAYFLKNDIIFWADFVKVVLKITNEDIIKSTPKITRETIGNIDLFIEVENFAIVIENKIKSGISGNRDDGYSQLEKYVKKAEEHALNCEIKYFILRPNYNNENYKVYNEGNKYSEIKYSKIYEIIKDRGTDDFYFEEFKKVIKKHSAEYDNELFEIMNERFTEQIKLNRK